MGDQEVQAVSRRLRGGGRLEFLGEDVPLEPWNPRPIPEPVQLNFATLC